MNFIQQGIQNIIAYAFGYAAQKDAFEEGSGARQKALSGLAAYYAGAHRKPLNLTGLGKDYNVITNHLRTIIDRSVSMLMGAGVEFDLPGEGESRQDEIINSIWQANKKDSLLHDLAQFGSIYGTMALKIIPDGVVDYFGNVTTRLVALNPYNLTIYSVNDDIENVTAYVYRWNQGETAMREVTEKQDNGTWIIRVEKADRSTAGKWEVVVNGEQVWPYPFPPIAHGKNLPSAGNVYGHSDIEDVIDLQDRYNEAQSNVNKILSLQAWAQKYIIGGKFPRVKDDKGREYLDVGPDKAIEVTDQNAKLGILQPSGDLNSSRQFALDIKRDIFDIAATVDNETVNDKVGALTNFGLRVLFKNELAKNATKQMLYGDLLLTVNNRLLQMAEFSGTESDPGEIKWGDPLPQNDLEAVQTLTAENALGIVSQETMAKERGYDWQVEMERKAQEKQAAGNVGANMIRDFLAGRGQ